MMKNQLEQIDKDFIINAVKAEGPDSKFAKMLRLAEIYEEANMTPLFLYDNDEAKLYLFAEETYKKRLH